MTPIGKLEAGPTAAPNLKAATTVAPKEKRRAMVANHHLILFMGVTPASHNNLYIAKVRLNYPIILLKTQSRFWNIFLLLLYICQEVKIRAGFEKTILPGDYTIIK
jgi:hypothetical protein